MSDAKLAWFRQVGGFEVVVSIREGYGLTDFGSMPEVATTNTYRRFTRWATR